MVYYIFAIGGINKRTGKFLSRVYKYKSENVSTESIEKAQRRKKEIVRKFKNGFRKVKSTPLAISTSEFGALSTLVRPS